MLISACNGLDIEKFKVTVTIEDNGIRYTGSAVQGISCGSELKIGSVFLLGRSCRPFGEAVPIKLGNKGWVFMIFSGYSYYDGPADKMLGFSPLLYPSTIQATRSNEQPKRPWIVPAFRAPIFVRFGDLNNRRTVEQVDAEHLDKHFGRGVKLVSIQCEPTFLWVTRGKIRRLLPWLDELGTDKFDMTLANDYSNILTQIAPVNFRW
ncbi:MAG: hypothetical protein CFE32_06625 [Alphaproteobacteria bacterium PA3]|nr:MAG: hypothetical protein CFE32_06625 [Alphaproteobacteria bacterium PA3]